MFNYQESKEEAARKWQNLKITNNFLFCRIMEKNPDVCKRIIEIILQKEVDILSINTEDSIDVDLDSKSIRMDVYVKTSKEYIDLEMQVVNTKELPKRTRYYSSLIDTDTFVAGADYNQLKPVYIIFLCMEDIFKKGLPFYTFENICNEDSGIRLNDESYKVFINMGQYAIMNTAEQKDLFEYFYTSKSNSGFTSNIDKLVERSKHNSQWRQKFMTWEMEVNYKYQQGLREGMEQGIEQGIQQGIQQGMERGLEQGILNTARNMLSANESIEKIMKYTGLSEEEIQKLK